MPTQRYKLTISYRGTAYHGWQFQTASHTWKGKERKGDELPTVQGVLEKEVARVVGHPVALVGASRTDAGVHAKGQVAHFDTDQVQIPPDGMRRAVNARLPGDMVVRSIEAVPREFDAIASTVSKRYQYLVWNGDDRDPFGADLGFHRWQPLDREAMAAAAQAIEGEHDFTSFCRPGHKRETTVRTVHECSVSWRGPRVVIGVEGSGFLWNMVRIIAGTLVEVGLGKFKAEEVAGMIAAKDRRAAGQTAPPYGLYLQWVWYGGVKIEG